MVPSIGNMYIQLVSSELVRRWNQLDNIIVNDHKKITFPKDVMTCGGAPSLHDLQLNQLPMDTFTVLTKPLKVFRYARFKIELFNYLKFVFFLPK